MTMELIQIIILNVLLFSALFFEKFRNEIPQLICLGGGVLGVAWSLKADAVCTWQESLIAVAVTFVLVLIFYILKPDAIGGGVLKCIIMSAAFLGRYTGILIVLFAISLIILMFFYKIKFRKKDYLPSARAMPFLWTTSLITSMLIFLFFKET